jgi:hypothetical protein
MDGMAVHMLDSPGGLELLDRLLVTARRGIEPVTADLLRGVAPERFRGLLTQVRDESLVYRWEHVSACCFCQGEGAPWLLDWHDPVCAFRSICAEVGPPPPKP